MEQKPTTKSNPYPAGSAGKKGQGVTSIGMKKYGRNVARAMNQRSNSGGRGK
jgi:hypothetical protein